MGVADCGHLAAQMMLAFQIHFNRSCAGISGRSLILFFITFVSRYASMITIFFDNVRFRSTYSSTEDNFRIEFLVLGAAIVAIFLPKSGGVWGYLEAFSIVLESTAMIPQLFLLYSVKEAEAITSHYIFITGGYRLLYVVYWILLFAFMGELRTVKLIFGIIQTLTYAEFFRIYFKTMQVSMKLPM